MGYSKTTWAKGDVVTSAKLNKIEQELYNHSFAIVPTGGTRQTGQVLMADMDDPYNELKHKWADLPDIKEIITITAEQSTQMYALVEQLKTAADSATTKSAATGVPFFGEYFIAKLVDDMSLASIVPVIKVEGASAVAHKYLSVYDASATYASFGYTEIGESSLYEIRFFVNTSSLIIRVTSCPYTVISS